MPFEIAMPVAAEYELSLDWVIRIVLLKCSFSVRKTCLPALMAFKTSDTVILQVPV